jgi:hypothetical protein
MQGINLSRTSGTARSRVYKNRDEITEISKRYQESVSNDRQRELLNLENTPYRLRERGAGAMLAALKSGNVAEASRIARERISVLNEANQS